MRIISIDLSYDIYERDAFDGIYYHMGTSRISMPWGFSIVSSGVYEREDGVMGTCAFVVSLVGTQNRQFALPRVCVYKNKLHD